jgi:hypothetical protein
MIGQIETDNLITEKQSFWRRQFASNTTVPQLAYDVVFGIVMPILCFIFDPIVFTGRGFIDGLVPLTPYKLLVYLFSGVSIAVLAAWLLVYRTLKSFGGVIAGILLTGAIFSLIIGILILPLSIFGLMVIIGILGFTPFFTAFAYLRNGIRAMKIAEPLVSRAKLVSTLLLGAFLVIAFPYITNAGVNRLVSQSMNDLLKGDPQVIESAIRRLKYVGSFADLNEIVWAYSKEQDKTRKQNLARAYKEITGEEIETRLAILLD